MKRNFHSVPSCLAEIQVTHRMIFGMKLAGLRSEKQNNVKTLKIKTSVPLVVTQFHYTQLMIMFRM
jgi:hypothetical protein